METDFIRFICMHLPFMYQADSLSVQAARSLQSVQRDEAQVRICTSASARTETTSAHGTTCKPAEPCNRIGFLRSKLACGAENRCGYGASSPHEQKEPRSGEFANEALQEKKDGEQPT